MHENGLPANEMVAIALHLFSVCPNSASCERLFSSFSNIMTKKRTRLSQKTLEDLAALRLHIRNEELHNGTVFLRAKERISAASRLYLNAEEDDTTVPDSDLDSDSDEAGPDTGDVPQQFSSCINEFAQRAAANDVNDAQFNDDGHVGLLVLFDFSHQFWTKDLHHNLREEMEMLEAIERGSTLLSNGAVLNLNSIEDELDHRRNM